MVTFNLKATAVALVFAIVLGVAGWGIRRFFTILFIWSDDEPVWVRALRVLPVLGASGGWLLGWWLVTS